MKFRASFCDPFNPQIIELGEMPKEQVLSTFERVPWAELLQQMQERETDVHYSPSLEAENLETRHGITISVVDEGPKGMEFYLFYKRPKTVSRLFGLFSTLNPNYLTEVQGQTPDDARACLQALLAGNYDFLEQHIK
jgi:hypothetical protein